MNTRWIRLTAVLCSLFLLCQMAPAYAFSGLVPEKDRLTSAAETKTAAPFGETAGEAFLIGEDTAKREAKQPIDMPSAGSTFKRPEGHFAAALIDQAGLRGLAIGGAQVSTKHTGFVVNAGDATSADVKALIAEVQRRVLESSGVALEPEVRMWGREA